MNKRIINRQIHNGSYANWLGFGQWRIQRGEGDWGRPSLPRLAQNFFNNPPFPV